MATGTPLAFLPPRLDRRVLAAARLLMPLWLRRSGIEAVRVEGLERLSEQMHAFQEGRSRLLLAFRHPTVQDPAVLAQLLWHDLPRADRFRPRPHAQFLYDRGIPLWAGEAAGWMLSHLGGCSIQRGGLDLPALRTARSLLLDGPYPFAVAPEGATNGHNEVVSPLEPGVAQLALWTADDLARAGRSERMVVLPLGLQYGFTRPVWPAIEALLSDLERDAGLQAGDHGLAPERLYRRMLALAERILSCMEAFYRDAYYQPLPVAVDGEAELDPNRRLSVRLARLLDAALQVVEQALAVEPHGDLGARCRRIEQAGWERLYPGGNGVTPAGQRHSGRLRAADAKAPDAKVPAAQATDVHAAAGPCPLEQGLAQRLAQETAERLWHMRLVESFVAVSGRYVRERPSQERFADTLLILWDTLCRIKGGDPERRPRLGPRRALVRVGQPLGMDPWLVAYRSNRRRAVADLTTELQRQLEGLIVPSEAPGGGALNP
ncbi:1-acyl-sn-glycerol-3-phosphate acyltransferase [Synechococcus sp. CBW1004]|uniref:1-acyl-sn-glycerol-3-phosphate acyltransferase n=1 Tax=Synechococcus sp. CBW1004 TaxID=1353136 RepID=UPI0019366C41|nr:1-acyl-sn-glycerol-3-phosphate acyltransferase [Synechococcus sp. CBW1004]QPN65015.1 1-acyl-sn-glycerol-3-phosphate acyltransferase [Synechococcus sp. CBW1004]